MITDISFVLDGNTAIHTSTKEEAIELIDMATTVFGEKLMWKKKDILSWWSYYQDECCYRFRSIRTRIGEELIDCSYCSIRWYEDHQYGILEFSDIHPGELDDFETGFKDKDAAIAALF